MTFFIIYAIIGAILFGISQFFTFIGREFASEPINWEEITTLFIWLFLFWPMGIFALVFTLLYKKKK